MPINLNQDLNAFEEACKKLGIPMAPLDSPLYKGGATIISLTPASAPTSELEDAPTPPETEASPETPELTPPPSPPK